MKACRPQRPETSWAIPAHGGLAGGKTQAMGRWGLDQWVPPGMTRFHFPGCPACVTPAATIDCSYGDILQQSRGVEEGGLPWLVTTAPAHHR